MTAASEASQRSATPAQRATRRRDIAAWQAYRDQSAPAQRLFALMRSLPGTDHGETGLGAAMALPDSETIGLLRSLMSCGLVETIAGGRFGVTPIGAALRPEWAGPETRAVQRWYDWCLAHVSTAADLLYPQALRLDAIASTTIPVVAITTAGQASVWLDTEVDNLQSAIHSAIKFGLDRFAWLLADGLRGRAWQLPYRVNWVSSSAAAVSAARASGGARDIAAAYLALGDAHFLAGDLDRAEEACAALGANAARAGWLSGCAASYTNRGGINHRRGRLEEAMHDYIHALELSGAAGRPANQATLYNNIGSIHLAQGAIGEAVSFHRRALVVFRQLGSLIGEARTLEMLAKAWSAAGKQDAAERGLLQAFLVYGRLGDRVGEARTRALTAGLSAKIAESPAA